MSYRYMMSPRQQVTVGTEVFTDRRCISADVTRLENGFDTATLTFFDDYSDLYPGLIDVGDSVLIQVKDANDAAWTTLFNGVLRFPILPLSSTGEVIQLKCLGSGYPLSECALAQEYGQQSRNPTLDTLQEILTDGTNGVIPKWVNKIMGGSVDSGYSINTDNVEAITGTIPYILSPYKPVDKFLGDLSDLVTAIKAGTAGPHWIVDTDSKLRVKLVDATQSGWTKYYGDSQAVSAVYQGIDFSEFNFEPVGPEANYIVYYGQWRRPSSGDAWTENSAASWGTETGFNTTFADEATTKIVNAKSVKLIFNASDSDLDGIYPASADAAWDFSGFTDFNTPTLNFYVAANNSSANPDIFVQLCTDTANYFTFNLHDTITATTAPFYHISLPIGPYYNLPSNTTENKWTPSGSPDWSDINFIRFYWVAPPVGGAIYVDGLHFGGAAISRVAKSQDATITSEGLKVRVITDDQGKDDSLIDGDDSGLMGKLAYAELLRLRKSSVVGSFVTPMIKDLLPGQWMNVWAKKNAIATYNIPSTSQTANNHDMRVTKLTQHIGVDGFKTYETATNDLTNSRPRGRWEDLNKQFAAMRPEWQDRQASSIKAGAIDIRVTPLVCEYA
jgi:hypothetical protein